MEALKTILTRVSKFLKPERQSGTHDVCTPSPADSGNDPLLETRRESVGSLRPEYYSACAQQQKVMQPASQLALVPVLHGQSACDKGHLQQRPRAFVRLQCSENLTKHIGPRRVGIRRALTDCRA